LKSPIDKKVEQCSPRFKLAGVEFCIMVSHGYCEETNFFCVSLVNWSDEDQITSVTFTHESGTKKSWQMGKVEADNDWGFPKFLSHEEYKTWARDHGDVFKLTATVTLHQKWKSAEDGWIRSKPSLGKTILGDDSTADFTIRCNTKTFHVHKAILCARSEVFRASILTPMKEAINGEIFVKDVGEKALGSVIQYLYTRELELGENPDISDLAWAGTKYLLPGFMGLLSLELMNLDLSGEMIANLLITAHRHEAENLRKVALNKIRANREIFKDEGFRKGMQEVPNTIMMDLFNDL